MQQLKTVTLWILIIAVFCPTVYGGPREGYPTVYGKYTKGHLSVTSYAENWNDTNITSVYEELMKNHHGNELDYLSDIYIYPDSPDGAEGSYYEDIAKIHQGQYLFGRNAYIEIFNGQKLATAEEMAPVLAHEYGHHYTIINMIYYEKAYYSKWKYSEYASVRALNDYSVIYDEYGTGKLSHYWDIAEIAANDYVQLLGSVNARNSYTYRDSLDIVTSTAKSGGNIKFYHNARPQENLVLPLATQVDGLYGYLMKIGGGNGHRPVPGIDKTPAIVSVQGDDELIGRKYTLSFTGAEGNGPFEYTVVMFPKEFPVNMSVLKTVQENQEKKVTFGMVKSPTGNGGFTAVLEHYTGVYDIRIYAKDQNGFVYASDAYYYDFGNPVLRGEFE